MSNAFRQDAGETNGVPPEVSMMTPEASAAALLEAASDGDAASVAALLASGASVEARSKSGGDSPLMRAAARGYTDVAHVLLDAGADASARRADGFTPLILAAFYGHEAVARLLAERGADPTARTQLGTTAARWAAARGFEELAPMLREAEAARALADAKAARDNAPTVIANAPTTGENATDVLRNAPAAPESVTAARADSQSKPKAGGVVSAALDAKAARSSSRASDSDEVSIFSRKPRWTESADAATDASSSTPAGALSSSSNPERADVTVLNVSVRSGGRAPAHPSASVFSVGHFLRSWQGSVGVALLLLALGLSVFALRGGRFPGASAPPRPQPSAPQAAQQPPAQALPVPQPSPTLPAETAQPNVNVTDPALAAPTAAVPTYSTVSPPYYGPPLGPAQSDAPRELMVVSESGASAPADRTKRKPDANANNNAAPTPTPEERRGESPANADARSMRPAEPEQRPVPPAPAQTPPATQPTPRAKVIQWPPQ